MAMCAICHARVAKCALQHVLVSSYSMWPRHKLVQTCSQAPLHLPEPGAQ